MDAVYAGAILPDFKLTDADREYIFFAAKQRYMKAIKTAEDSQRSWVTGWAARKAPTGTIIPMLVLPVYAVFLDRMRIIQTRSF